MRTKNLILVLWPLLESASALQCFIEGECIGQLIGFTSQNTTSDCLAACKETEGCNWFTFMPGDDICSLMLTCPEVNDYNCDNCVSGEVSCPRLCGEPGLCQGFVIHREEAGSTAKCQIACTDFNRGDGCNAYSYDPTSEECFMFYSCPTLDDTFCPDCVSGSPGCPIEDYEEHFLMVIGGYSYSRRSLDDVELLSLDPTAYPVPDCLTQLNPLPVPIRAAGGALDYSSIYFNETYYDGGIPFFCGGDMDDLQRTASCWRYNASSDSWFEHINAIGEKRAYSGYGSGYNRYDWGLVMAGGVDTHYLSSVVSTDDGTTFDAPLPDLPEENVQSCLVIIDYDRIFTCGGYFQPRDTFIFSNRSNSWRSMAQMPVDRHDHSCGLVRVTVDPDYDPYPFEIVVAGGEGSEGEGNIGTGIGFYSRVDIYNIYTDSWREGKRLPQPQTQSAVVPLDYTFLLTGGLDADFNELAHVYQYDVQKEDWIKLPTELKTPRKQHVALRVPRDLFAAVCNSSVVPV